MLKVTIAGASGRMGRLLLEQIATAENTKLVGALEHAGSPELGADAGALVGRPWGVRIVSDPIVALRDADVVIDFSNASATAAVVRAAAAASVACVVGTTGLSAEAEEALREAAMKIPVLASPNMSLGVQVLAHALAETLRLLGADWDVEIIETHHRAKRDAPSGTALRLADVVTKARGLTRDDLTHGRHGGAAQRRDNEVGMHAVRGGDVVGDHTVLLAGAGERIELTHKATSRAVFAAGALRAARWLKGRAPGRYSIGDVLGIAG